MLRASEIEKQQRLDLRVISVTNNQVTPGPVLLSIQGRLARGRLKCPGANVIRITRPMDGARGARDQRGCVIKITAPTALRVRKPIAGPPVKCQPTSSLSRGTPACPGVTFCGLRPRPFPPRFSRAKRAEKHDHSLKSLKGA